jgi:hypothetical protein
MCVRHVVELLFVPAMCVRVDLVQQENLRGPLRTHMESMESMSSLNENFIIKSVLTLYVLNNCTLRTPYCHTFYYHTF